MGTTAGRGYFYNLTTNSPLYAAALSAPARCSEIDWNNGILIVAGDTEKDGELSFLQFCIGAKTDITKTVGGIEIGKGACCLTFCHSRSEVYIGYENGVVGVVALRVSTGSLICKTL